MISRLFFVILISFFITAFGHFYIYLRVVEPLHTEAEHYLAALVTFLWGLTFFGFAVARAVPVYLRRFVEFPMFVWMGIAYVLLILCFFTAPIDLYYRWIGGETSDRNLAIIVLSLTGVITVWGLFSAFRSESVVEVEVPVKTEIHPDIENLRVVVLSDIHVAGLVGWRRMKRIASIVNQLHPDIVFVTGDLVDGSVKQLGKEVLPLAEMKPSLGVYYITGNHEYYCNAPKWKAFVSEKLSWKVLSNESQRIAFGNTFVNLLGVEDRAWLAYARRHGVRGDPRLQLAAASVEAGTTEASLNLLLAHQPKDARQLKTVPWIDLQISGHTHGGQLWPLHWIVLKDQQFNNGLHRLPHSKQQIYVNTGTGFWGPPMRLGSHCEITLMKFVREKA